MGVLGAIRAGCMLENNKRRSWAKGEPFLAGILAPSPCFSVPLSLCRPQIAFRTLVIECLQSSQRPPLLATPLVLFVSLPRRVIPNEPNDASPSKSSRRLEQDVRASRRCPSVDDSEKVVPSRRAQRNKLRLSLNANTSSLNESNSTEGLPSTAFSLAFFFPPLISFPFPLNANSKSPLL